MLFLEVIFNLPSADIIWPFWEIPLEIWNWNEVMYHSFQFYLEMYTWNQTASVSVSSISGLTDCMVIMCYMWNILTYLATPVSCIWHGSWRQFSEFTGYRGRTDLVAKGRREEENKKWQETQDVQDEMNSLKPVLFPVPSHRVAVPHRRLHTSCGREERYYTNCLWFLYRTLVF